MSHLNEFVLRWIVSLGEDATAQQAVQSAFPEWFDENVASSAEIHTDRDRLPASDRGTTSYYNTLTPGLLYIAQHMPNITYYRFAAILDDQEISEALALVSDCIDRFGSDYQANWVIALLHDTAGIIHISHRQAPQQALKSFETAVAFWTEALRASTCLLYTSPSPRDKRQSRMPSSA